jgi:hypothetical protein
MTRNKGVNSVKNKRSKKFLIYIMMVYIMLFQSSSIVLAAASTGTIPSQEGEIAQESNSNSEKENDTLPEANLSPETEEVECGTGYIEDKFTIPSIQEEIEPNMGVNSFSMQQQDTE